MIYTTYFAKLKFLPAGIVPVAICQKPPNNLQIIKYTKLAPPSESLFRYKTTGNESEFALDFYTKILAPLDAAKVVAELFKLAGATDIALVCYEKPTDFCHRQIVCHWLNANGIACEEFTT